MTFKSKAIRDKARKRIAQQVKAGKPCALCNKPIDLTLKYPDLMSFTVDHIIPVSHGGQDEYSNYRPAHATCNRERGNLPDGTVDTNSGVLG